MRRDVEKDLQLLSEYAALTRKVKPEHDPKLARLAQELIAIVEEADREGLDAAEAQQLRTVLVFSHFRRVGRPGDVWLKYGGRQAL